MKKSLPIAILLCGLTVALSACGSLSGIASTPPIQESNGRTIMVEEREPNAIMEAMITGTLTLTESGCFALEDSDGTILPMLFPFGTRLSVDGETIHVPGLSPLRVGDDVEGGGGYLSLTEPLPACPADNTSNEYVFWQTVG